MLVLLSVSLCTQSLFMNCIQRVFDSAVIHVLTFILTHVMLLFKAALVDIWTYCVQQLLADYSILLLLRCTQNLVISQVILVALETLLIFVFCCALKMVQSKNVFIQANSC